MEDIDINNTVGLMNFGNTCFINSSIQLIMSAPVFCIHLLSNEELLDTKAKKYLQTIRDYMNPKTTMLGPKKIHISYMNLNTRYRGFTQEDSHEFIVYTLDDILTIIKTLTNENYVKRTEKLITYTLNTKVTYKNSGEISESSIRDYALLLPINQENPTLDGCLQLFMNVEEEDKTIQYSLSNLPKYLIITLKRFSKTASRNEKNDMPVQMPLLTDICGVSYKLKAIIDHQGTINGGHYVAFVTRKINNENKWFYCSDTSVLEVNVLQVEKQALKGYMFLYSKIDY